MQPPQSLERYHVLPPRVVVVARIIWFAILTGEAAFASILPTILQQRAGQAVAPGSEPPVVLTVAIDAGVLIAGVVAAVLTRWWLRASAVDFALLARRYVGATIVPLALLDGAVFFGLVMVLVLGRWWPSAAVPAVAGVVQLLLFPRARVPMRSSGQ